jgi:hypothetical protein
MTRTI